MEGGPAPAVSVVICTRDRPQSLRAALDSVLAQVHPSFEVVVVDQSASHKTAELVLGARARHPSVVYLPTPSRGLSRARNAGVAVSLGSIVAFTDDDCTPPADWLSRVVDGFASHPSADLLYGQVTVPPRLAGREGVDGVTPMLLFDRRQLLSPPRGFRVFGMGANCAFRRSAFDRVGGFDPALGAGGRLQGGEDFDFSFRVFRSGGAILLDPAVAVEHHGFRSRAEWPQTVRAYGVGVGSFYFKHVRAGDALAGWLLTKMLIRETAGVLRKLLRRRPVGGQWSYVLHVLKGIRLSLELPVERRRRLYVLEGEAGVAGAAV